MTRVLLALAALLAPVAAAAAGDLTYGFKAGLDARQQIPRQTFAVPNATGTLSGELVVARSKGTLAWQLTFRGLSGPVRRAELRRGALGRSGPLVAGLCGPCRSGAHGTLSVRAATVKALMNRGVYVELVTRKNPAGEIRGQLRVLSGA
jgi:hypothetical protein